MLQAVYVLSSYTVQFDGQSSEESYMMDGFGPIFGKQAFMSLLTGCLVRYQAEASEPQSWIRGTLHMYCVPQYHLRHREFDISASHVDVGGNVQQPSQRGC